MIKTCRYTFWIFAILAAIGWGLESPWMFWPCAWIAAIAAVLGSVHVGAGEPTPKNDRG